MIILGKKNIIDVLNHWAAQHERFRFVIDFDMEEMVIERNDEAGSLSINDDYHHPAANLPPFRFDRRPVDLADYKLAFDQVMHEIRIGNSFLLNLAFPSSIFTELTLRQIYQSVTAKYRVLLDNRFVAFSPESFVKIDGDMIYSFPMKGTIDASLPDARQRLLADEKELAEHYTIVDLIRNDISRVAREVSVPRFRYVDHILTSSKSLLQVSSEIRGQLDRGWQSSLGDILAQLLPAGSITGAPKVKTVEIIKSVESRARGFYTGICGTYQDGKLDTGVLIRYIAIDDGLVYMSGGGITYRSDLQTEYQEVIDKVYLPFEYK